MQQYHTAIVGGDICRSPTVTVAITAFGQVNPDRAIRRCVAQPGDAILVTGVHGASRAGLELLLHPDRNQLSEAERSCLIQAHQRPRPRLDVIPLLSKIYGSSSFRVAGMDSSDGLADAVLQICRASGVGAQLDRRQIPVPSEIDRWAPDRAIDWALYGGEDFELVLCLPPDQAETLRRQIETTLRQSYGCAIVGTITAATDVVLRDSANPQVSDRLSLEQGFQHF